MMIDKVARLELKIQASDDLEFIVELARVISSQESLRQLGVAVPAELCGNFNVLLNHLSALHPSHRALIVTWFCLAPMRTGC